MATVQFIGYQIQTAATGDMKRKNYPGFVNGQADIEMRCKVMADAINAARKSPRLSSTATKVFVAPEFFFRGGRSGAYSVEDASRINPEMDKYLANSDFAKWIFVLGTATAVMPGSGSSREILNIALVRKGGVEVSKTLTSAGDAVLVYKEYVSAIDFLGPYFDKSAKFHGRSSTAGHAHILGQKMALRPTSGSHSTGKVKSPEVPNEDGEVKIYQPSVKFRAYLREKLAKAAISQDEFLRWTTPIKYTTSEHSTSGLGGGVRFDMGGLGFCLEICLDHAQERARHTVKSKEVDIHIITSCGMEPNYGKTKSGGYLFACDGITHDNSRVWLYKRKSSFKPVNPVAALDMSNRRYWNMHPTAATNIFQAGRGTVHIFPEQTLP